MRVEAVGVTLAGGDPACAIAAMVVIVPLVVLGIVVAARESRKLEEEAAKAAARLGGRYEAGGWLERPSIRFRACGQDAVIMFWTGGKNDPAYTRVVIPCVGKSPGALKVYPEGFGTSIAKWFGAQDLEVGDPTFDARYVVKATPVSLVQAVFGPPARDEVIATLRTLGEWSAGSLDVSCESLSVKVMDCLRETDAIVRLARIAETLYARIVSGGRGDTGIVWGASAQSGGRCQVCGAELAGEVVKCAACATPHHRDCWRYVGACSTFACRSRRFV